MAIINYRKRPVQLRAFLDGEGRKYCDKCGQWKYLDDYYLQGKFWVEIDKVWYGKPVAGCKECRRKLQRNDGIDIDTPPEGLEGDIKVYTPQRLGPPTIETIYAKVEGRNATDEQLTSFVTKVVFRNLLEAMSEENLLPADVARWFELHPEENRQDYEALIARKFLV